jgi:hypothetical protein
MAVGHLHHPYPHYPHHHHPLPLIVQWVCQHLLHHYPMAHLHQTHPFHPPGFHHSLHHQTVGYCVFSSLNRESEGGLRNFCQLYHQQHMLQPWKKCESD